MPFEPLRTDEKLETPVKPEKDMDTQMIMGCSAFVFTCITSYLLAVWPHFVFVDVFRLNTLLINLALGLVPALAFGAFTARRYGLVGACGSVGSFFATGIFLYLRLDQMVLATGMREAPEPEYPASFVWVIPLFVVLASAILAIVCMPKSEWPGYDEKSQ